jgi:hypothetical protein
MSGQDERDAGGRRRGGSPRARWSEGNSALGIHGNACASSSVYGSARTESTALVGSVLRM